MIRVVVICGIVFAGIVLAPVFAYAQETTSFRFRPGEELVFNLQSSRFGHIGYGYMGICGPDTLHGKEVYILYFDLLAKVTLFSVEDRTRSWFDPVGEGALRFYKRGKNPLASNTQHVELWPESGYWIQEDGRRGKLGTVKPLDELSFIYFLRTLPLENPGTWEIDRYYNPARNPVIVRSLGQEVTPAGFGDVPTLSVEMQVRDPDRFGSEEGILRFQLSNDAQKLPVRIETHVPFAGQLTLTLVRFVPQPGTAEARSTPIPCPAL